MARVEPPPDRLVQRQTERSGRGLLFIVVPAGGWPWVCLKAGATYRLLRRLKAKATYRALGCQQSNATGDDSDE
jgi:hypothetical protein